MYGVAWPEAAENTIRAKTKKLMDTIGVADVAENVSVVSSKRPQPRVDIPF